MADRTFTRRRLLAAAGGLAFATATTCGHTRRPTAAVVRLRDGRRIAFNEYGNPSGRKVVLYHHGQPSCLLEAELLLPALADRPDVRLIAFDRPGVGGSDYARHTTFDAWACDLVACADALCLGRFGLTGTSTGTPFMLAAALRLGERVTALALACPVAELTRYNDAGSGGRMWRQLAANPLVGRVIFNSLKRQVERNPRRVAEVLEPLTPDERRRFDDPKAVDFASRLLTECLRDGSARVVEELGSLARPWRLNLAAVRQPVAIFSGDLDRRAPLWMGESLARQLPNATHYHSADGHFSLPERMAGFMLDAATA